ncbi:molybdate ABC transporter substrate-binding protein [Falsirhodobacter sp. alg1]|uniref:molybdate ABC transporter substrate-binding protein n=1 Tax=Falsirhodobacter sp. alg1 TaxID=1472418 RepID=UPI001EDB4D45|nr:molybdate ABC transporter substrate-binding protein [Falsirhodobacter sp. alg1]
MLRILLTVFMLSPLPVMADNVTVFAAASMKTALDEITPKWEAESGDDITVSYAGSSVLAKQIIAGAPADIFISASTEWMDAVEEEGLVIPGSRKDFLGNSLVFVGSPDAAPMAPDVLSSLNGGKLAMAFVDSVPAGIYGKQALTSLGIWNGVAPQVAQADNVRSALALVATGEAPYGVVYATDAIAEPRVKVVGTISDTAHDPIIYPIALIDGADEKAATGFLAYLQGDEAATIFKSQGFKVPD